MIVKLSTHSAGGITDKDFALARRIEDVALWRPPAGDALDGHAEQVRAERRSALMNRRVLFVTGRLAEPSLRRVLGETAWPFDYDVAVLKITVAALMTTDWIARNLNIPDQIPAGTDLVLIPGLCEGDAQVVTRSAVSAWRKGRKTSASSRDTSTARPRRATTARGTSRLSPRSTTRRG